MAYAEAQTGAIRMVAFGVIEFNLPDGGPQPENLFSDLERAREVERLVVGEFTALGWKIANSVCRWRGKNPTQFVLLGPLTKTAALTVRPKIGEGSLREVCLKAVTYLETGCTDTDRVYAE